MNKMALLALMLSLPGVAVAEDWPVGGDVVECSWSMDPDLPAPGYYAIDYFANQGLDFAGIVPVLDYNASLERIHRILAIKLEALSESFTAFRSHYRKWQTHLPQFWLQMTMDFRNLNNPDLVELLPHNCWGSGSHMRSGAEVLKVIKREVLADGRVMFLHLPTVLDELERKNPLQLSYLLVHEWLWSVSNHPARNRRINHFLHSRRPDLLSASEVKEELRGMGLAF